MSAPSFVQWLNQLNACSPAVEVLGAHASYEEAYNQLDRPDWLLWICLRQAPSMPEVQRILDILIEYMRNDIGAAIPDEVVESKVSLALDEAKVLVATEQEDALRRVLSTKISAMAVIDPSTKGFVTRSYAITLATRLLRLSISHTPADAAEVGIEIGNAWTEVELRLGKVQEKTKGKEVCDGLRAVLPFTTVLGAPA